MQKAEGGRADAERISADYADTADCPAPNEVRVQEAFAEY
jgi:hypothetical protein